MKKLYAELGWESLSCRRRSRRMTVFFKIINNFTPLYTKVPVPPSYLSQYSLRNQDVLGDWWTGTDKFQSSFYPNCIFEWNKLDPVIRNAPSIAFLKPKVLSKIHPLANCLWNS